MFKSDWVKLKQQIQGAYFDYSSWKYDIKQLCKYPIEFNTKDYLAFTITCKDSDHYLSFVGSMIDDGIQQLYYIDKVILHRK